MKPKEICRPFHLDHLEPRCLQTVGKTVRIDRDESVANMNQAHECARQAVASRQFSARAQDSSISLSTLSCIAAEGT